MLSLKKGFLRSFRQPACKNIYRYSEEKGAKDIFITYSLVDKRYLKDRFIRKLEQGSTLSYQRYFPSLFYITTLQHLLPTKQR